MLFRSDRKPAALPAAVPTVSLKSIESTEPATDEPKLHHDFDEVKEHEHEEEDGVLMCQCRYCDPAGLIWDVDQNCYSPFLTPPLGTPSGTPSSTPSSTPSGGGTSSPSFFSLFADPVRDLRSSDLLLRRSWSEPSPSRKNSESSDCHDSDRRSPPSHQALEVSSEIVTSHYGHRDIEIKFFSARPSSPASEGDGKQ